AADRTTPHRAPPYRAPPRRPTCSPATGSRGSCRTARRLGAGRGPRRREEPARRAVAVPVEQVDPARRGRRVRARGALLRADRVEGLAGRRPRAAHAGAAVVVEGAGQLVELAGDLGVGGGDDVPVFVLGDGEEVVHVLDLGAGHADGGCGLFVGVVAEVDVARVGAHGGQAAQDAFDGGGVAGGEQAGEVFERDAHLGDRGEQGASVLAVVAGGGHDVDDGGQGWDVPDHGQGAVLGVQGQRDLVLGDEVPDGGALGGRDPVVGDALGTCGGDDVGVVRVEEDGALGGEEVVL